MDIYSFRSPAFNKSLEKLSPEAQRLAHEAFLQWSANEGLSPSKKINRDKQAIAVRVSESIRAVGMEIPSPKDNARAVVWFFIGKHSEYEHLLDSKMLQQNLQKIKEKMPKYHEKMLHGHGRVKPHSSHKITP